MVGQATVLLGPPASGKGTQGRLLSAAQNLAYLSTGRQLRKEVADNTACGKLAEAYLADSRFVPDQLVLDMVSDWLRKVSGGWILDGFPRTVSQAKELDRILGPEDIALRAIMFEVNTKELEQRVAGRSECQECSWTGNVVNVRLRENTCPSCGGPLQRRLDDVPENFRKRLKEFQDLTLPVASYYDTSGRLLKVCGVGTQEQVFKFLQSKLM